MFFENFLWGEEKLGLIAGVSFILIGVLGYAIYLQSLGWVAIVLSILAMLASAGTAILFQLPRIRGMRAAIGTFLGGLSIGGAVILWVIAGVTAGGDIIHGAIVFAIIGSEVILSFFAVGFLVLAIYPPDGDYYRKVNAEKSRELMDQNTRKKDNERNQEIDEDILDRL